MNRIRRLQVLLDVINKNVHSNGLFKIMRGAFGHCTTQKVSSITSSCYMSQH